MDDNLSSSEAKAREDLVALCREIAESYPKGYEFNVTLECEECGDEIESGELCDSYKEEVAAVTLAITKAAKQNDF